MTFLDPSPWDPSCQIFCIKPKCSTKPQIKCMLPWILHMQPGHWRELLKAEIISSWVLPVPVWVWYCLTGLLGHANSDGQWAQWVSDCVLESCSISNVITYYRELLIGPFLAMVLISPLTLVHPTQMIGISQFPLIHQLASHTTSGNFSMLMTPLTGDMGGQLTDWGELQDANHLGGVN